MNVCSSRLLVIFPPVHSLFDIFELLDILDFDVVWVVCEQVDGAWNHVFRQQAQQFVCEQTHNEQIWQFYLRAAVLICYTEVMISLLQVIT